MDMSVPVSFRAEILVDGQTTNELGLKTHGDANLQEQTRWL
jgi:spore coat protein CotH